MLGRVKVWEVVDFGVVGGSVRPPISLRSWAPGDFSDRLVILDLVFWTGFLLVTGEDEPGERSMVLSSMQASFYLGPGPPVQGPLARAKS